MLFVNENFMIRNKATSLYVTLLDHIVVICITRSKTKLFLHKYAVYSLRHYPTENDVLRRLA